MRCHGHRKLTAAALGLMFLMLSRSAAAQSTIAGQVTDTTGAVLPGVSVEASSPALIEKVRTVVSNADGRYSIVDLRPGTYAVSFMLAGFSTVRREGIDVSANVTVPVNAEMRVSAVAETITVTGATPVVDIQQAAQRQVLSRDTLDALPTARSYLSAGAVVSTVKLSRPEVGGINVGQGAYLSARGKSSADDAVEIDGLDVRNTNGVSQSGYNNFAMVQDVTYQTSSIGADSEAGGIRINMIPREGGNTYRGDFYVAGSGSSFQSSNITPELRARGLPTPDSLKYLVEATPSFGGPIFRDRLWFFASGRYFENKTHPAGAHYRDGQPADMTNYLHMASARVTFQPTSRNKITAYLDKSFKGQKESTTFTLGAANPAGVEWETATTTYKPGNYQIGYVKWSSPLTNRLLLEAGGAANVFNLNYNTYLPGIRKERGTPEWYASAIRRDLVLATLRGAPAISEQYATQPHYSFSSSASYVTGSHTFKTGVQVRHMTIRNESHGGNADLIQNYRNGVPDSVAVGALPFIAAFRSDAVGLFAMDSWTLGRLTVNPGLRFDRFTGGIEASAMQAGRFVPARQVPDSSPVPHFNDLSPRLSAVYDLFGNAKTALKVSANKYLRQYASNYFYPYSPITQDQETRQWFDCDLIPGTATCSGLSLATNRDDIAQDNEIGPGLNRRFGLAADRRADPDLKREYYWDYSVGVQHELLPGISVTAGWYYNRNYNAQRSRNMLRSLSDYVPFTTTSPLDGAPITIFNLDRSKLGIVDIVDVNSDINRRMYSGYDLSIQARRGNGGMVLVGWAMERIREVSCDTDNPNPTTAGLLDSYRTNNTGLRFCDQTGELHQDLGAVPGIPYRHEFKVAGSHPLPWGFQAGVSLVSYPGATCNCPGAITPPSGGFTGPLNVLWAVPPALFPGGRTEAVSAHLIAPGDKFLKRWNQLDLTVKRSVRVGRFDMLPAFEIYNLLNSSVVLNENQNFGPALGTPSAVIQGRFVKLGALVKF
jgi:hypothetical protein